jgi:hypothetical protein
MKKTLDLIAELRRRGLDVQRVPDIKRGGSTIKRGVP